MRRALAKGVLPILGTIAFVSAGAYFTWTGAAHFLLFETSRRPAVFTAVGIMSLLPFAALLVGQALRWPSGSVTLLVAAFVLASLSAIAYASRTPSYGRNRFPQIIIPRPSFASVDVKRVAFVTALECVLCLGALGVAYVSSRERAAG